MMLKCFLAGMIGGFFVVWLMKWLRDGWHLFRPRDDRKGLSDRPRKGLRWPR